MMPLFDITLGMIKNMSPNSNFKDAFEAIVRSAHMLVEQGEIQSKAENVVKKAFSEVGITSIVSV